MFVRRMNEHHAEANQSMAEKYRSCQDYENQENMKLFALILVGQCQSQIDSENEREELVID